MNPDPPRLFLRLAESLIDERMREPIIGDLVEEFIARPSRWRFARQTLSAIARFPVRPRLAGNPGGSLVTGFIGDLGWGVRTLRRAPGFTLLCAATLGLGIGAATAIFSVADPIIIRPLPYPEPDRAFVIWENDVGGQRNNVGFATFADVGATASDFSSFAALGGWTPVLNRDGTAEQLTGLRVSWTYFRTLGVHPALGHDFVKDDDAQGHFGVIMLSHALWRTRFGGDSGVVGRFADINGTQMVIAGVMPADFDDVMSPGAQLWRVLGYDTSLPFACRSCRHLRMIARLAPGATPSAAASQLAAISARLVQDHPHDYPAQGFQLVGLQREASRQVRPALIALLAGVGLLLLIAAANVGGLQLARALRRDEEFAVRTALGAGAGRLTRQLLAEGLVLACIASIVGLAAAKLGIAELLKHLPPSIPRLDAVTLDPRAFAFAALITIVAGLALGLVPAAHARRSALADSLRGGRRIAGASHRLRGALVIGEVAVAVVLLAAAGLLARSLGAVLSVDPGFDPSHVATVAVQVSGPRYNDSATVLAWHDQLLAAVRAIPAVTDAAIVNQIPLGGNRDTWGVQAQDKPLANPELAPYADRYTVTSSFLRVMHINVTLGRDFTDADNAPQGPPVAIVSRSLAHAIWGDENPIGKLVHGGEPDRPWYTVVGVAADVHHEGLDVGETRQLYVPTHRWFFEDTGLNVVARTSGDPAAILGQLRTAALKPDRGAVVQQVATMDDVRSQSTAQRTLALALFGVFASMALLLAGAGLFGALTGAVAERRREFGLRAALGATPGGIALLVLRRGLGVAGAGAAIGIALALGLARVLSAMLFGVGTTDLVTFASVALVMAVGATLVSLIPAWRAVRADPVQALRAD